MTQEEDCLLVPFGQYIHFLGDDNDSSPDTEITPNLVLGGDVVEVDAGRSQRRDTVQVRDYYI